MEAVWPDVSQNLASLDTCHVMSLDVAATMLSKFVFLSAFVSPTLFCVYVHVLLHSLYRGRSISITITITITYTVNFFKFMHLNIFKARTYSVLFMHSPQCLKRLNHGP